MEKKDTQNGNYSTRRPTTFMNTNEYYDTAFKLKFGSDNSVTNLRSMLFSAYGSDVSRSGCNDSMERHIGEKILSVFKDEIYDNPDSAFWKDEELANNYYNAHDIYSALCDLTKDRKHTEPNVSPSRPAAYFH